MEFADGTVWTRDQLLAAVVPTVINGTPGSDTLQAAPGPNIIDGRGGGDYEQGHGGADTFVFELGYGQLDVNESVDYGSTFSAVLALGEGIDPSQVKVQADSTGYNLVLTDGLSGDMIRLDNMARYYGDGVAQVRFADGTTWSRDQLIAQLATVTGTPGADTLYGTSGANLIDGQGGGDYEQGNGGGDTYVFNPGYGQLEVNGTNSDELRFGAGIALSQVQVRIDASYAFVLTDGVSGDQIRLDGGARSDSYVYRAGVQRVEFADGTTWSQDQLISMELAGGTSGADSLYGTGGPELFDGQGGGDYEQGGGGVDTFVFDAGYGPLEINEDSGYSGTAAVLRLGPGISASQVTMAADQSDGLLLTVQGSNDSIQIDRMLSSDPYSGNINQEYGIQAVQFADGTTWSRDQLVSIGNTAGFRSTPGPDTLRGTSGPDLMDGLGGGDYEIGNGGGDTFVFNDGYGRLQVNERDSGSIPGNVLQLGPGITPTQVNLVGNANDWNLAMTTATNGDQVTLDNQLLDDADGVQQIQFMDGTVWDRSQILKVAMSGSPINTALYGSAGDDLFDPKGYAHDVWGYGGNDAAFIDRGYGQVAVHDFDAACKLVFSETVAPDQLWLAQSGNDLIVQILGTADSAKLEGWSGSSSQLHDVRAAGGAQLDSGMGQLAQAMASYQAAHAGFDPATAAAMPSEAALQGAITSAWHH